jgi:hypothetical protein
MTGYIAFVTALLKSKQMKGIFSFPLSKNDLNKTNQLEMELLKSGIVLAFLMTFLSD